MPDESHLDSKYFIDDSVYNCPFCNRGNLHYYLEGQQSFDWTDDKKCYLYFVNCSSCKKKSMHLSYEEIALHNVVGGQYQWLFQVDDIDSKIFHSVPTSFFVLDSRIPSVIRELVTEAGGLP